MANIALPQSSLGVTGDVFHDYKAMPINDIDGKNHKTELKSSHNYSTNCLKSKSHH